MASELSRESSHIQAYLSKENRTNQLDTLANNSIQITLEALNQKDLIIKDLQQKLANSHLAINGPEIEEKEEQEKEKEAKEC
ncbi:9093_t:CDS:2 [Scutellospora calospora]|uniref:9093_t:CDS:1 n=1 Tax=Scutellospora calospora TaxID=85575 RepID=A0ACA9LAY1_9GLOM|nr:9093_t:CDS:2 [Scutellospora calospora]